MKKFNECINEEDFRKGKQVGNIYATCETFDIINELFIHLQAIFPAFKQAWPTQEIFDLAKSEWLTAFKQAGINDIRLIKKGLKNFRLMENPFVPSPGQFISMCKEYKAPEIPFYQQSLPAPANRELALKSIQDLKKMLC